MEAFEKLGVFYLGRAYDLDRQAAADTPLLYDSRDLVTHGAIIGMTGSGKTGLGLGLLEEAAIDGIPAIAIDPKGDLPNLLLTFPDLSPRDFEPWVNADEAARKGLSVEQYAAEQAEAWRKGLAAWGQDGERIRRLRAAADFVVYTPGSTAGLPLSILRSLEAPPPEVIEDHETFAERVNTSISGLLTLAGLSADPVTSREHILLSTITAAAWRNGESVDLATLIQRVQSPPVCRIGVLDVDAFFPPAQRFDLATRLNNLVASPAFATWLDGEPIDIGQMLHTPEGRPRVAIVSIAHLGDAERMFIVSLLLGQVLGWMRRQAGTSSLRAILYMDEVAGYVPPTANPPSKAPLLTLLKQARAFGLGVVLATQNPVDLDYKALSNIGSWFLGRLQTDRDKQRVLDGLEGALAGTGQFDRAELDRRLSALGKRVFLLNNVHERGPLVFETRWAMSYLAGPMTREQIRTLMAPRRAGASAAAGMASTATRPAAPAVAAVPGASSRATEGTGAARAGSRPVLPPEVPQFFVATSRRADVIYTPRLFCTGSVQFTDAKLRVDESRNVSVLGTLRDGPVPVDWEAVEPTDIALGDLDTEPVAGAGFAPLPSVAGKAKLYETWQKEFARWLAASQTLELLVDPVSGLVSRPGEAERDFRIRVQQAWHEQRDADKQRLQQKYAPKLAAAADRVRRLEQAVEREAQQASASKMQVFGSALATGLGALFGRKALSATTIGRATSTARSASRVMKESADVERARRELEEQRRKLADLEDALQAELAAIESGGEAARAPLETLSLRPKRTQVTVQRVVLVWIPSPA